jgi:pyruvate kinase
VSEQRTKIVATVGPSCRDPRTLEALVGAGAEVFRVNGAHALEADLAGWVSAVRRAGEARRRTVGVLLDLPGPKMRVGALGPGGVAVLETGRTVRLAAGTDGGSRDRLPVDPLPTASEVPVGTEVLVADGRLRLRTLRAEGRDLLAEVLDGGEARAGAGVHLRAVRLPFPVPTERDRRLAEAGVSAGVDFVGLSFVRGADDVVRLRECLDAAGGRGTPIVAKVERLEAVAALDEILAHADAVMIARGDLGVDAGPEQVPTIQLRVLDAGRRVGRPVIVATEMLESMVERARPTRAEASDVASAVFSGADAVMLSQETAIGAHPVLAVETMARILTAAEADPHAPYAGGPGMVAPGAARGRPDQHVVRAAVGLARDTGAQALVVFTRTGKSAVRMSKERPSAPIVAFASSDAVCRQLALAWGVRTRPMPIGRSTDEVVAQVARQLREEVGLAPGSRAVLAMGGAGDPAGATTLVKLLTL